jgi:hypothetical protein
MKRKNKSEENCKRAERKIERRETSMKRFSLGYPSSSNVEALDDSRLCYDKESSEDVSA